MKKILYILFCLLPILGGKAQTIYKDQIRIEKESATRSDDNRLTVSMDIVLQPNLKMSSNNATTLTPFLESNGHTKELPSIVIYGRKRQLINERNHQTPASVYTIVRRQGKTEQTLNYLVQVPSPKRRREGTCRPARSAP